MEKGCQIREKNKNLPFDFGSIKSPKPSQTMKDELKNNPNLIKYIKYLKELIFFDNFY